MNSQGKHRQLEKWNYGEAADRPGSATPSRWRPVANRTAAPALPVDGWLGSCLGSAFSIIFVSLQLSLNSVHVHASDRTTKPKLRNTKTNEDGDIGNPYSPLNFGWEFRQQGNSNEAKSHCIANYSPAKSNASCLHVCWLFSSTLVKQTTRPYIGSEYFQNKCFHMRTLRHVFLMVNMGKTTTVEMQRADVGGHQFLKG
jgi:hypothetical protein